MTRGSQDFQGDVLLSGSVVIACMEVNNEIHILL